MTAVRHHPLYNVYNQMRARCCNPNAAGYANYGGRGIIVCDRWLNNFWDFVEDMGERPDGYTLDRIDNDGPYAPDNCRWADWNTQVMSRRPIPATSDTPHIVKSGGTFLVQVTVRRGERSKLRAPDFEQAELVRAQLYCERDIYKNLGIYF